MNEHFNDIRNELELNKQELEQRLNRYTSDMDQDMSNFSIANLYHSEKEMVLNHHIRKELDDVNRALLKMDLGLFGICETTGQVMPPELLKVLPTARTADEVTSLNGVI